MQFQSHSVPNIAIIPLYAGLSLLFSNFLQSTFTSQEDTFLSRKKAKNSHADNLNISTNSNRNYISPESFAILHFPRTIRIVIQITNGTRPYAMKLSIAEVYTLGTGRWFEK